MLHLLLLKFLSPLELCSSLWLAHHGNQSKWIWRLNTVIPTLQQCRNRDVILCDAAHYHLNLARFSHLSMGLYILLIRRTSLLKPFEASRGK